MELRKISRCLTRNLNLIDINNDVRLKLLWLKLRFSVFWVFSQLNLYKKATHFDFVSLAGISRYMDFANDYPGHMT